MPEWSSQYQLFDPREVCMFLQRNINEFLVYNAAVRSP